jgi:photosystem II stability/assembly factor-like uncharacterized protein
MNATRIRIWAIATLCMAAGAALAQSGQILQKTEGPIAGSSQSPAARLAQPETTMILGATRAGHRIVAVGDRGLVMLSDDDGAHFRQAAAVPTRAALTSVVFVGDRAGWAVGHWGVILATTDGGENWKLQRDDLTVDQPLFSVWFRDAKEGMAVGLFSLALATHDGGASWQRMTLPAASGGQKIETNLFSLFPGQDGSIMIAGEQGMVVRSEDMGRTWTARPTGSKGTLWAGVGLRDGALVVGGLRGKILRSRDRGHTWSEVPSGTESSITSLAQLPDGRLMATALDGVSLSSDDGGRTFQVHQRVVPVSLTALAWHEDGRPILFSTAGIERDAPAGGKGE